jgi:hypothetical protein
MIRHVLLPVGVMCMIACFMCFELQCNYNELNILQEIVRKGFLQLFVSWVNLLITRNEALAAHTCRIYRHFASLLCLCTNRITFFT